MRGHIAKFCRTQSNPPADQPPPLSRQNCPSSWFQANSNARETINSHTRNQQSVKLNAALEILLDITVGEMSLKFLYDPGSQYMMIPIMIYNNLPQKRPLAPVDKVGIGISGTQFKFDCAAHLNLKFKRSDSTSYILEYEPVLVSRHISTCIFGIHSE